MANLYKVRFYHEGEDGFDTYHQIEDMTNASDVRLHFVASELCECPEDATLYRDLFNGWDYIEAIKVGIKLAHLGYDDIAVEHC